MDEHEAELAQAVIKIENDVLVRHRDEFERRYPQCSADVLDAWRRADAGATTEEERQRVAAAWEHYFAAAAAHEDGDLERAFQLTQRGLEEHPGNVVLLFNAACYRALGGNGDEAIDFLRRAYEADPDRVREVAGDPDLNSIRDRPDWPL